MRLIYWLTTLAIAILLTVFAVPNRERVDVVLWPFLTLEAPLYLVTLLALLVGFFAGALVAWINGRHWRRTARRRARRIEALERELSATQAQLPHPEVAPLTRSGTAD